METQTENRLECRSNVFLSAAMETGSGLSSVRIRNLSPGGALIEGSSLPSVGARVKLMRGGLFAVGNLAWESAGHAGINFAGPIDVEKWVRRIGHSGQQCVDQAVAAVRGGHTAPEELKESPGREGLATISTALDEVCGRLAAKTQMTIEFAEELLKLDAIAQSLRFLATGKRC